jgi:hypothetical protein
MSSEKGKVRRGTAGVQSLQGEQLDVCLQGDSAS